MERDIEASDRFYEINIWLYETDIPSDVTVDECEVVVMGEICVYRCVKSVIANYNPPSVNANLEAGVIASPRFMFQMPDPDAPLTQVKDYNLDDVWRWKDRIRAFISNPEGASAEKVEWLSNGPIQDKICLLIVALEKMPENNNISFNGTEKPYLYFEECTMEDFDDAIVDTLSLQVLQTWKDIRDDGQAGQGLRETIRTIVGEVMGFDNDMYFYDPGDRKSADPLKHISGVGSSCYLFVYQRNREEPLLICMQFGLIDKWSMNMIRLGRGDYAENEEEEESDDDE